MEAEETKKVRSALNDAFSNDSGIIRTSEDIDAEYPTVAAFYGSTQEHDHVYDVAAKAIKTAPENMAIIITPTGGIINEHEAKEWLVIAMTKEELAEAHK